MADKVKTEVLEKSAEISEEQKNEEILREFSKEDNVRRLNRPTELLVNTLAFLLSVFLIYTSAFGTLPALQQRSVYLTFVMAMLFLVYPASSKKAGKKVAWYDYIFSILAAVACIYVVVEYKAILLRMGISNNVDIVMGTILIILILEGTRRLVSPALAVVTLIFLLYALFGNYVPGIFHIKAGGLSRLIDHQFMIPEGIFGTPLGVSPPRLFRSLSYSRLCLRRAAWASSFRKWRWPCPVRRPAALQRLPSLPVPCSEQSPAKRSQTSSAPARSPFR